MTRPAPPTPRRAPTTTSCWTRTSPPATAAATRTSASPPSTTSSTPSTTASSSTSRTSSWRPGDAAFIAAVAAPRTAQLERRAAVPGGALLDRDAVPAPGLRGVRPQACSRRSTSSTATTTDIDPAIVAEFAHTVYRFGHSMLTETLARTSADGTSDDIGLIEAFLNPLEFTGERRPDAGAGGGRDRPRHDPAGRQRDRRVRHRGAAQQPARPAARPRRRSTSPAAATPASRR